MKPEEYQCLSPQNLHSFSIQPVVAKIIQTIPLKGVVCGNIQISVSLLPAALSQPFGEIEVLVHKAHPSMKFQSANYLGIMIIIKDWKGSLMQTDDAFY